MTNLLAGTEVQARGLRWEVVSSSQLGSQVLYRLRLKEGDLRGEELDLLSPFEAIEPIIHELQPERAAPLQNWRVYHQAFLLEQALGPNALLAVQPGRLKLEPYQLVPVLRAIRMSRVRLMLADGVGLGKTIQAGLVLTELMARRVAHRILIVSPAGPLLEQWKLEMAERFGLRLDEVNRSRLEEIRRSQELGANPFDHVPLGIASVDFLKQERILDLLERASYDVVVIDEAHHCMDAGSMQDRDDSQRRRLAELLARRCDSFLLLTATPHDGNDRSFASLCELLDPSLVDGRGSLRAERYKPYVVRRLKHHVIDPITKENKFRERIVEPCAVEAIPGTHDKFIELQRGLLELLAPELRRAFRNRRYSDVLAYLALLKRSVSTAAACQSTLTVVAERFQDLLTQGSESQENRRQRMRSLKEYHRKLERFGSVTVAEEQEQSLLEAEDLAQKLADLQREIRRESRKVSRFSNVVDALDELISLAQAASHHDPKLDRLVAEIQAIRAAEPDTNILVYSEYTTSQQAAAKAIEQAKLGTVLTMSGENSDKDRKEMTDRFCTDSSIILVSTDTAAEGLNLQKRCHHLLHLELPFNPNRLEQRNGRIDRFGQTQDPIVKYLYLRGTFEERILLRLIAKYERQRSRLTFVPNTLGLTASTDTSEERLLKGLLEEDQKLFQEEMPLLTSLETVDETEATDEATRELLEEVDRSLKGFEKAARTHSWFSEVGLNSSESLLQEADTARAQGSHINSVDLVTFVQDAVLLEGGKFQPTNHPEIFEVMVPPSWCHGLDELPGYDSDSRCLRLTNNLDILRDAQNRPVGFLGRAHPLVRRALDRVRNLSFGSSGGYQDPRVSAIKANVESPTLLFTFLARLASGVGPEFERVLAVRIEGASSQGADALKTEFFAESEQWLALADRKKAIKTTDVWATYFESWWSTALQQAEAVAEAGFGPLMTGFVEERQRELRQERRQQQEWLETRVAEITGAPTDAAVQIGLFDQSTTDGELASSRWAGLTDPIERLSAFATDSSQSIRARNEADGVLRIYQQRAADLDARLAFKNPDITIIGALMLVPEK
jgi:superfamily II DNA or RNA helicase